MYQENQLLWHCFEHDKWKSYSIPEKITVMQRLTDFETEILGIPSITITADLIGAYTLGSYSDETNEILVNTKCLDSSPAEECVNTICHKVQHSLQFQIVSSIDWIILSFKHPILTNCVLGSRTRKTIRVLGSMALRSTKINLSK